MADLIIDGRKVCLQFEDGKIIYPSYVQDGLILHYDFKGLTNMGNAKNIVRDLSITGYDAELKNFSYSTGSGYSIGKLTFDGIDDYIGERDLIFDDKVPHTQSITVNLKNQIETSGYRYFIGGGLRQDLGNRLLSPTGGKDFENSDIVDRLGMCKIDMTFDGDNSTLYINGEFIDYKTFSRPSKVQKIIGASSTFSFRSKMDCGNVMLYDRVLTAEEIKHNYEIDKKRFNIGEWIEFADPLVGQILFDAGLIADPTYSTKEELAEITDLGWTLEQSEITKFPELQYCTSLVSLNGTFVECFNLTEAPVIPNSVTDMYGTFGSCEYLIKPPIIPDSVTNMEHTFGGCFSLTEAPVIPDSVTNMEQTFSGCSSLTEAPIIPDSVTNMTDTFYGCTSLNGRFIIEAVTPPTADNYTFYTVNVVSIKVPASSVQAYKTATGWIAFADKIFPIT